MKAWITLGSLGIALGALTACGSEYELNSTPGPTAAPAAEVERDGAVEAFIPPAVDIARAPSEAQPDGGAPAAEPQWTELPRPGGAAVRLRTRADDPSEHEETFRFGGDAPTLTDVLFVVDGSSSMKHLVDKVRAGMGELDSEGVFPAGTRIAVMNMTPSDPRKAVPLRTVRKRGLVRAEPGFHGLVSEAKLANARQLLAGDDKYAHQFDLVGCDAWFAPTATSADGTSCLVAHTQILEAPMGVEAGLTSAALRVMSDDSLFRPGAAINLVFVSDTHDPGLPPEHEDFAPMTAIRPTAESLVQLIEERHTVASVRFHAVAPTQGCTSERFESPVYHHAAEATGGGSLDICTAQPADYVELMRRIAVEGSRPTAAVLPLSVDADDVASVTVDGRPVGFSWSGRTIVLDGEVPSKAADVQVRYRTAPAVRTRTR